MAVGQSYFSEFEFKKRTRYCRNFLIVQNSWVFWTVPIGCVQLHQLNSANYAGNVILKVSQKLHYYL